MSAPTIYRSTDTNAPVLNGSGGSLISLLDAILVNGYGSVFATGTLTSDGAQPADGDTVTVGSVTYTFRTSIAAVPNTVAIGVNVTATFNNLANSINLTGTAGVTYGSGTLANPDAWSNASTGYPTLVLQARRGGTTGNSIALARASAGTPHYSVSGATLTGGSGTDTKASVGWTRPFSGTAGQAVYRQPAGCGFYLQVDDTGQGTGLTRDARTCGFETMSAYNTGTGQFPTVAQGASLVPIRKSSSVDTVNTRAWIAFADDRTFYLFTYSGDVSLVPHSFTFGDFYSYLAGDPYKCLIASGQSEAAGGVTASAFGQHLQFVAGSSMTFHFLPRNYTGVGGSTAFIKSGDGSATVFPSGSAQALAGVLPMPNPADGGLYIAVMRIIDGSTPATPVTGTLNLRGRMRGLYHICHPILNFADQDTFAGSGDYAGRSFLIQKIVSSAMVGVETTAWDTSA